MRVKCVFLFLYFLGSLFTVKANEVEGKVMNQDHVLMPYVNIFIKGTQYGATTNNKGFFRIEGIPKGNYLLIVSTVGYQKYKKEINIKDGQTDQINILLHKSPTNLSEVVVSRDNIKEEIVQQSIVAQKIDKSFLDQNIEGSLMQTLKKLPGINSIDIGSSNSKPIIRGMSFNRVATVDNGIKLEGQQWGEMHGLEIDQYSVEGIKLIRGPASLMYGSDAIAGVVEILPPAIPREDVLNGEFKLIGKSNNRLLGTTGQLMTRKNGFFVHGRITYLNYGDFHVPEDTITYNTYDLALDGKVKNTAGRSLGIKTYVGKLFTNGQTSFEISNFFSKNGFYADAFGVELRTQRPVDHAVSERDVHIPYQTVNHFKISNHTKLTLPDHYFLDINVGWQNDEHIDFEHLTDVTGKTKNIPNNHQSTALLLNTISGNVKLKKKSGAFNWKTGVNASFFDNHRSGFDFNVPAYQKYLIGMFLYSRYEMISRTYLNAGIRYDYGLVSTEKYINPRNQHSTDSVLSQEDNDYYKSVSGMIGFSSYLFKDAQIKFNLGKSYRIPSIRETNAHGMIWSSARYEVGNDHLNPEEAYQADILLEYNTKPLHVLLSGFSSYFPNYIYAFPSGDFNDVAGAGQIYCYKETEAYRSGAEFVVRYNWKEWLRFSLTGEYVYAINMNQMGPLPFTPPLSLDFSSKLLKFGSTKIGEKVQLLFGINYMARQEKVVQNEVPGGFTPEAMLIYTAVNIKFNETTASPRLNIKVNNLLDKKYYNHLSIYRRLNVPEPGRNIQVTLNFPIHN